MRDFKPPQHFGFIMRNVDAWNSLAERVTTDFDRAQRGKLLERKLHRYRKSKSQNTNPKQAPNSKITRSPLPLMLSGAKHLCFSLVESQENNQRSFAPLRMTIACLELRI